MKSQKGFALIQVIIAASIFSALSLAMASLITDQRQATNYLEDQLEKIQVIRNIETVLKDGVSCQKTLAGINIPDIDSTVNISSIKDNTGAEVYKSNTTLDSRRLKVGSVKVKNQSIAGPSSSGFVEVEVPISRVREGGGPQDLQPYKSKLSVTVDGSKDVASCGIDYGVNLSYNGYQELPSGMIVQWGRLINVSLNQTYNPVTFPIPFPNRVLNVTASIHRSSFISGTVATVIRNTTQSGCQIAGDHDTHTSFGDIYWQAIGH